MARKQTIEELEKKKAQLEARIALEKAKLRTRSRKEENRRKVLMGAAVLYHAENDPVFKSTVMKMIDGFLRRADERAAFDLAPLPDSQSGQSQNTATKDL